MFVVPRRSDPTVKSRARRFGLVLMVSHIRDTTIGRLPFGWVTSKDALRHMHLIGPWWAMLPEIWRRYIWTWPRMQAYWTFLMEYRLVEFGGEYEDEITWWPDQPRFE